METTEEFRLVRAAYVREWGVTPELQESAPEPEPREGESLVAMEAAAVGEFDLSSRPHLREFGVTPSHGQGRR